jgi:hypothetical protein
VNRFVLFFVGLITGSRRQSCQMDEIMRIGKVKRDSPTIIDRGGWLSLQYNIKPGGV